MYGRIDRTTIRWTKWKNIDQFDSNVQKFDNYSLGLFIILFKSITFPNIIIIIERNDYNLL